MKVLLINGSPRKNGCTYTALTEVSHALENEGIETEIYQLGVKPIAGCIDCKKCRETGKCIFRDEAEELFERAEEFDGLIVGSPVYFSSPNGSLIAFLDRFFYLAGKKLKYKPGAAVVSARRAGTTASLDVLNKYFLINNMPVVSSQYWNMVHGNTPDEVRQDKEGLQIMRTLGRNMAWLLKSIKFAEANGINAPVLEEQREVTNFI